MRKAEFPGTAWADVVFTGAGVSMGPPTALPSGADLTAVAWQAVRESLPDYQAVLSDAAEVISTPTASDDGGLRLEHLMNLIDRVRADRPLVEIYDLVKGGQPNELHALIAELPAQVATVNMDLLHEAASPGGVNVMHLHGDVDHEDRISTTIEQYLIGVPDALAEPFVDAIAGRRVLVVGWGSRDLDIVELFLRHPPAAVHLIQHGSAETQDPQLSDPARIFLQRVAAQTRHGAAPEVTWQQADATELLRTAMGREQERLHPADAPRRRDWPVPERAAQALGTLSESARVAAAIRVLFASGEHEAVIRMAVLARRRGASNDEIETNRGRSLRKQGQHRAALMAFLSLRGRENGPRPRPHPNEISALLPAFGLQRASTIFDTALVARAVRRGQRAEEVLPLARRVQLLNVRGRIRDTAFDAERVWQLSNSLGPLGLGNQIDAITWSADALKLQGRFEEAIRRISEASDRIPYSNPSQSAWAMWKLAELQLLAGRPAEALQTLDRALPDVRRAAEASIRFWMLSTRADAERTVDPTAARGHLAEAARINPRDPESHAYFRLIAGSLDAAEGRHSSATQHLLAVTRMARSPLRPIATALVAAKLIRIAFASSPSAHELRRIARRSYRIGLDGGGQRAASMLLAFEDGEDLTQFLALPILM